MFYRKESLDPNFAFNAELRPNQTGALRYYAPTDVPCLLRLKAHEKTSAVVVVDEVHVDTSEIERV